MFCRWIGLELMTAADVVTTYTWLALVSHQNEGLSLSRSDSMNSLHFHIARSSQLDFPIICAVARTRGLRFLPSRLSLVPIYR
jgi:hypothetical protein